MAVWVDLRERVAAVNACEGVQMHAIYHERLPAWLASAWAESQDTDGIGALLVNAKGLTCDNVLAVLTLADLERLLAERGNT